MYECWCEAHIFNLCSEHFHFLCQKNEEGETEGDEHDGGEKASRPRRLRPRRPRRQPVSFLHGLYSQLKRFSIKVTESVMSE